MAIQSVTLDPNAAPAKTGDEMIADINSGTAAITREGAIDKESLNLVGTNPVTGEYKVRHIQRQSDGLIDIEYDDTPAS